MTRGRGPSGRSGRKAGLGTAATGILLLAWTLGGSLACGESEGRSGPAATGEPPRGEEALVQASDSSLAALARELLPEVARISGLPREQPVSLAVRSRKQLSAYLEDELDEQLPEERARRLASAYRRLGLLPDTLRLRGFLRELYLEQVAGYYDPETDTLFVMEGAADQELRTVLVHEMVHALQDQRVDLDSLAEALDGQNDRETAFQSAVEGQATYVMTEWRLGEISGQEVDLTTMPELMERIRSSASAGAGVMPVFASAPRIIRETLTFPYLDGMGFVQQLWRERGARPAPFGDLLPLSSEQVLHPEKLGGEGGDPPTVIEPDALPTGWEERYGDSLGELEFRILLAEHLGAGERAARLASGWDGDLLVLAADGDGREALFWISVWDTAARADSAAAGLREAMAARTGGEEGRRVRVLRRELAGRAGVVMLDLPGGASPDGWLAYGDGVGLRELSR